MFTTLRSFLVVLVTSTKQTLLFGEYWGLWTMEKQFFGGAGKWSVFFLPCFGGEDGDPEFLVGKNLQKRGVCSPRWPSGRQTIETSFRSPTA